MKLKREALILFVVLLLTSCSTPGKTGNNNIPSGPTATPMLPTIVHVTRPAINGYPSLDRTIRDTKAVQHLYQAAYALSVPPSEKMLCPLDDGIIYYLTFLHGTTPMQRMTLQATGWQLLQLDQKRDRRSHLTTEAFRSLFLKTVDIPSLVPGVS